MKKERSTARLFFLALLMCGWCARRPTGTYLITANTIVFEGSPDGLVLWKAKLIGPEKQNAWQAVRIAEGKTLVSSGYGGNLRILDDEGEQVVAISGPKDVNPHFYAGMQILSSGNIIVTNWQAHGPGHGDSGVQLLEYAPDGKLVWSWHQTPDRYSSLQGVIVLDGLDINQLHVEGPDGKLSPVR